MSTETKPDPLFAIYFLIHIFCWGGLFVSSIFGNWPMLAGSAVGLAVSSFMLWVINEAG